MGPGPRFVLLKLGVLFPLNHNYIITGERLVTLSQMLHVGNIYLHFRLNVAIFHLMWVNNPYMDPMGMVNSKSL